jgi:hypothetical protein
VETLLAFAAALLSFRLAGQLARRYRARRAPEFAAWSGSLGAYALASAALAWGSAAGWDDRAFRVYYLFGGLLTAPLLGAGSLLLAGRRWALPFPRGSSRSRETSSARSRSSGSPSRPSAAARSGTL